MAFDDATANVYAATASKNGEIFQFSYDGTSVEKEVQSPAYEASEPKMNLGLAFDQGLVVGNYYLVNLGLTQTGSFDPEGLEDDVPRPDHYMNTIGIIPNGDTAPMLHFATDSFAEILCIAEAAAKMPNEIHAFVQYGENEGDSSVANKKDVVMLTMMSEHFRVAL